MVTRPQMESLDLFSGICGISIGLEGFAKPIGYCDSNPACRAIIKKRIACGDLPQGAILDDVRGVDGTTFERVEAIAAGFPCQGLSQAGKRRGLSDERSGLFYEILRIGDLFGPKLIFLENVSNILSMAMGEIVEELHTKRAYDLRWICLSANDAGAPHLRRRWFCIASVRGFKRSWSGLSYSRFDWSKEPPRLKPVSSAEENHRIALLGNSVVPDAVRLAFVSLASLFTVLDVTVSELEFKSPELAGSKGIPIDDVKTWPKACVVQGGRVYGLPPPTFECPKLDLVLDAGYVGISTPSNLPKRVTSPLAIGETKRSLWATPRFANHSCSHILTLRSLSDIGTMLRFEKGTPEEQRKWVINVNFIEWIMGYRQDFTGVAERASGGPPTVTNKTQIDPDVKSANYPDDSQALLRRVRQWGESACSVDIDDPSVQTPTAQLYQQFVASRFGVAEGFTVSNFGEMMVKLGLGNQQKLVNVIEGVALTSPAV